MTSSLCDDPAPQYSMTQSEPARNDYQQQQQQQQLDYSFNDNTEPPPPYEEEITSTEDENNNRSSLPLTISCCNPRDRAQDVTQRLLVNNTMVGCASHSL